MTRQQTIVNILQIVFQVVNILIGMLVLTIGVLRFASVAGNRLNTTSGIDIIITSYICLFGLFTIICSFFVPSALYHYISFMCHFITRGLYYIFLGGLVFTKLHINIVASVLCWSFGIVYIILFFIPGFRSCVPLMNHCIPGFDKYSAISQRNLSNAAENNRDLQTRLRTEDM